MGKLQLVATPIGNLEDVTLRALRTLAEADLLLAEDTRRVRVLLDRHAVKPKARPVSLHERNEASRIQAAIEVLNEGGDVALVSDAGTPLVSDPGGRLVAEVIAAGHVVESIPGASAAISALVVSGLPAESFTFLGFLPRKAGPRRAALTAYRGRPETLVLYESPRRVAATLALACEVLGDRRACAARELTKLHEEVVRGSLSELAARFDQEARGEFTLVIEGEAGECARPEPLLEEARVDDEIRSRLAAGRRPREIAAELAAASGLPRRQVYARVLSIKEAP